MCVCVWVPRTYADKLSPKVVQSLLDLLCSQLKNLLSQAAVNLLSSGGERDNKKQEEGADHEKRDIRGDFKQIPGSTEGSSFLPLLSAQTCAALTFNRLSRFSSSDPEAAHR